MKGLFYMNKKDAIIIIETLKEMYPDAKCSLDFSTPFQMLVSVVLSAQCTDERVNKTTPSIFSKYSTPQDFADMDIELLEELIHPCGFYKTKAKNLKRTAQILVEKYDGMVPNNMEDLMSLPGVGRKSANVIMLEAFDLPQGIAVDTHCKRIANRLGFSSESDPAKIEQDLLKVIPKEYYKDVNHIFIWHGRNVCTSQKPKCDSCKLQQYCKYNKSKQKIKNVIIL